MAPSVAVEPPMQFHVASFALEFGGELFLSRKVQLVTRGENLRVPLRQRVPHDRFALVGAKNSASVTTEICKRPLYWRKRFVTTPFPRKCADTISVSRR